MSSPQDDDRYESYLMETWTSEVTKYDRTVLSLAGGALALSVTFIRDIAADQPRLPVLVGVGWLALILSMGLIVSSYPTSKHAVEQRWNHNQKRGDLLSERAWHRSLAAGVSLSLGALLVAAFAWLNLIA